MSSSQLSTGKTPSSPVVEPAVVASEVLDSEVLVELVEFVEFVEVLGLVALVEPVEVLELVEVAQPSDEAVDVAETPVVGLAAEVEPVRLL